MSQCKFAASGRYFFALHLDPIEQTMTKRWHRPPTWRADAEAILDRGRRLDNYLPTWLVSSPLSYAGYLWATAVGFVWGALWSTGKIERRYGLFIFRGMPSWTYARGGQCVGACFLTGDYPHSDEVLQHEAVHRQQWLRYGMLLPVLYLASGRNPLRNRFEIEAGLEDGGYVPRGA
jgi:hypothetical protein